MATLPTNFKDDIIDTSVNTRRRYRVYENTDGTIELEDVTEYSQVGDVYGAGQINATNTEVNKKFDKNMLVRDLDTINAITKEGYAPDALALKDVNDSFTIQAKTSIHNPFNATTEWGAHNNSFTANSDGWLFLLVGIASKEGVEVRIGSITIMSEQCNIYETNTAWKSSMLPIRKGQTVTAISNGNSYIANSYFYSSN